MILRSVMRHVRDQNWFAVGVDFLIVVVGVFIGIQVANWNETGQRDARSETAQARPVESIRTDLEVMRLRSVFFDGVFEFGEYADSVFAGEPPASDEDRWAFLVVLFQAGQIWPWSPNGQVYREMQSAGQLDLIGGAEIHAALSAYYDESAREIGVTFGAIDPYRALIRRRMPWPLQDYMWNRCYDFQAVQLRCEEADDYLLACPPPEDLERVRSAAQELSGDQEVSDYLRGRLSELRVTMSFIENVSRDARTMIEQVERHSARVLR